MWRLPLSWRKQAANLVGRLPLTPERRKRLSMLAIADWTLTDEAGFHAFLWRNHLGYAQEYNRARFKSIQRSRLMFFEEMAQVLRSSGRQPDHVRSILEVGASVGHNLRYLETTVFRSANVLHGIDVDGEAVRHGRRHLASIGSRVQLERGDAAELFKLLAGRQYDVVYCAGLLLYFGPPAADAIVHAMLRHSGWLVGVSDLANPTKDNQALPASERRLWSHPSAPGSTSAETYGVYTHNVDAMAQQAGGRVISRHYEQDPIGPDETVYFVFIRPADADSPTRANAF